jgi:hypothetical protein
VRGRGEVCVRRGRGSKKENVGEGGGSRKTVEGRGV